MKKKIAKYGKRLLEKLIFQARKVLVEPRLDPRRDSVIISWATYSPWLLDREFQACHKIIKHYTLVDVCRCYELWHLLAQTSHLKGDVLEVGVWRGGTGGLLGRRAQLLKLGCEVFLCDTFEGVVKTGANDRSYFGGEHSDTSIPVVQELIDKLGLTNIRILKGIFPEETAGPVADRKFRLCHIDVDAYQSAKDVLHWVWPRLEIGAMIVFDDFGFVGTTGVTQLVHEEESREGLVCVQNINGHAVFIKIK